MNNIRIISVLALMLFSGLVFAEDMNPEEFSREVIKQLKDNIDSGCSSERKQMCEDLNNFLKGSRPKSKGSIHSLGTLFSGDLHMKYTLEYSRRYGILYLNEVNNSFSASFAQIEAETEEEIKQAEEYIDGLKKGKLNKTSPLHQFIVKNGTSIKHTECKFIPNSIFCDSFQRDRQALIIREYKGYFYTLSLTQVPKMADSWDTIPGFYISKMATTIKQ